VPAAVVASSEQPVLISLVQYNAYVNLDGSVAVTWETGVELNQVGYNVYRSSQPGGSYDKINSELILAEGGYTGNTYQLTDNTASPFGYTYYTLEEINSDGKAIRHGPMAICVNCTPQP
jgi:hypothetical protein